MMKRLKKSVILLAALAIVTAAIAGCTANWAENETDNFRSEGEQWYFGFSKRQILPNENSEQPLYIAGYNSAMEFTGVLDYCEARAVWLDTGSDGILLIGIDCVALDSGTVQKIRDALADIPNCAGVNVYATHTHAGIDTLGLWGPTAIDGKNDDYMNALVNAAVEAAKEAAANRHSGTLYFGVAETEDMYRDSRDPQVFDPNLYQLRFQSEDGTPGLRLLFYGAHAESLRGANSLLSRDYPGQLCDNVTDATGDDAMFFPGAIGGLIMTREFVEDIDRNAEANLCITAERLTEYALSITSETERQLQPGMMLSRTEFTVPMENTVFLAYRFLGILNNKAVPADSATGYSVQTELSVLMLDDVALTLIPGEIFPELVYGGEYGDANPDGENPETLISIAKAYGIQDLLVIGLCNDELGYIVPPSDFLLNEDIPYLDTTMDHKDENHYEETNSLGPNCAGCIADAFTLVLKSLYDQN